MAAIADLFIDISTIAAYLFGIILIYVVGRMLLMPFKLVIKLIYNALVGGILLWVFNFGGAFIVFTIPINIITALTVGFLGVPGVVLLILFKIFFK